jgi:hypothetical protein
MFIFVRTIQNLWRIGIKRFGKWNGVEHGWWSLENVWFSVMESEIWRGLFQLPLRHTFDYLRHLSTFVCKSLLTYMPSRIGFFFSRLILNMTCMGAYQEPIAMRANVATAQFPPIIGPIVQSYIILFERPGNLTSPRTCRYSSYHSDTSTAANSRHQ